MRLPGNIGALPASEVPYDPGKYAGSDSSKRDGGGSSPTPPLPEGDSNFSEDQLTVADAAGGGAGRKNKKTSDASRGLSSASISAAPPVPPTLFPGSSASIFSLSPPSPGGVGDLSDFYDDDFLKSESDDEEEEIINAPKETGLGGSSGSFSDPGSWPSGFNRLMSRAWERIRKPLAKAYINVFGDPRSVKEIFNIHGPEVDLLDRQRELLWEFCLLHKTCEGFETEEEAQRTMQRYRERVKRGKERLNKSPTPPELVGDSEKIEAEEPGLENSAPVH